MDSILRELLRVPICSYHVFLCFSMFFSPPPMEWTPAVACPEPNHQVWEKLESLYGDDEPLDEEMEES